MLSPEGGRRTAHGAVRARAKVKNRAADPYSMRVLEQAIGGAPPPGPVPEYASGAEFCGRRRGIPAGSSRRHRAGPGSAAASSNSSSSSSVAAQRSSASSSASAPEDLNGTPRLLIRNRTKTTSIPRTTKRIACAIAAGATTQHRRKAHRPDRGISSTHPLWATRRQGALMARPMLQNGDQSAASHPSAQNQNPAGRTEGRAHGRSASRPPIAQRTLRQ